jgi:hypothetical protein
MRERHVVVAAVMAHDWARDLPSRPVPGIFVLDG